MNTDELMSYMCLSCKGTGLDGATYEDVWNACQGCDGVGEVFEDENE